MGPVKKLRVYLLFCSANIEILRDMIPWVNLSKWETGKPAPPNASSALVVTLFFFFFPFSLKLGLNGNPTEGRSISKTLEGLVQTLFPSSSLSSFVPLFSLQREILAFHQIHNEPFFFFFGFVLFNWSCTLPFPL